jgi:signal recognition particle GTPase
MKNIIYYSIIFALGTLLGYFVLSNDETVVEPTSQRTIEPEKIVVQALSIDGVTVECHVIRRGFETNKVKQSVHDAVGEHTAMWLHSFGSDSLKIVGELSHIGFDKEFEQHLIDISRTNGDYIRAKKELEFALIQAQVEKEMVDKMVDSLERAKKRNKSNP